MTERNPGTEAVTENRREQLRRWIKDRFDGNQAAFGTSTSDGETQINQGELSGLLRTKSFGERRARRLEVQAGMPHGYLDSKSAPKTGEWTQAIAAESIGAREPAGRPQILWPFKLASFKRLNDLRQALGPRGHEALTDIDKQIDIVMTKWEREAEGSKKRSGRR